MNFKTQKLFSSPEVGSRKRSILAVPLPQYGTSRVLHYQQYRYCIINSTGIALSIDPSCALAAAMTRCLHELDKAHQILVISPHRPQLKQPRITQTYTVRRQSPEIQHNVKITNKKFELPFAIPGITNTWVKTKK